jgi:hypothetical protein
VRIESLQAELAKLEATAARHRADYERERDRADRLLTELLKATANTTGAMAATLEGEIAAMRLAAEAGAGADSRLALDPTTFSAHSLRDFSVLCCDARSFFAIQILFRHRGEVLFEPARHVFFFPQNLLAYKLGFGICERLRRCDQDPILPDFHVLERVGRERCLDDLVANEQSAQNLPNRHKLGSRVFQRGDV